MAYRDATFIPANKMSVHAQTKSRSETKLAKALHPRAATQEQQLGLACPDQLRKHTVGQSERLPHQIRQEYVRRYILVNADTAPGGGENKP